MSKYTAKYTPEESACYAASVEHAISERLERRSQALERDTALRRLAKSSLWYQELGGRPPREVISEARAKDGAPTARAANSTPSSSAGAERLGAVLTTPDSGSNWTPYQQMGLLAPRQMGILEPEAETTE